jgi:Jacalin-like lectin domain
MVFRYHPCFLLPTEIAAKPDQTMYWPCENGLIVTSPSGIILVLIRVTGTSFPVGWFEYAQRPEQEVFLFESDIKDRMPEGDRESDITLEPISAGGGRATISWQRALATGTIHLPQESRDVFRSREVNGTGAGTSPSMASHAVDVTFKDKYTPAKLICLRTILRDTANIGISHAHVLYSIEFCFADGSSTMFGAPRTRNKITDVVIDAENGEVVTGFMIRAGEWIDALKVVTNRRESNWLGYLGAAPPFSMIPPQGYEVIGVFGKIGPCCESLGVLYTSNV